MAAGLKKYTIKIFDLDTNESNRHTHKYPTLFRLQMRKTGTSHKKKSCSYHDLSKAKEGAMINSMDQVQQIYLLMCFSGISNTEGVGPKHKGKYNETCSS